MPVIKVATRNDLARRWHDLMDVNAGRIASGEAVCPQARLEPLDAPDVFLQIFAEKLAFLQEQGWTVLYPEVPCPALQLQLDPELLCRIADNLVSNLQKYADPGQPVRFGLAPEQDTLCVSLSNTVRTAPQGDSHGVGLKNVSDMMALMHGQCCPEHIGSIFCLKLYFPLQ